MSRGKTGGGRLLAERAGASGNDPEVDAIVQLCLEMEEEHPQAFQPELLPQAQWTTYGSQHQVSGNQQNLQASTQSASQQPRGNQWDLQASAQSGSFSAWGGLPPYSTHVPLTHQGPSMQSGYGSLTPSANSWEAPESPGEGPSTSAWGSTLLPQSVGSSLTTGSLEYGAPMPPVDDTAPASLQGHDASSFAYATSGGVPSGYLGAGSALPQAQLWAQPNSSTQLDQHPPQQDMHSLFYETSSARKRGLEEHAMWNPPISPKKPKASSKPGPGTPQQHESSGLAPVVATEQVQILESANTAMTQNLSGDSGRISSDLLLSGSGSHSLSESLVPSTSQETSSAALVSAMQQTSAPLEVLSGYSQGVGRRTGDPDDKSTVQHLTTSGRGSLREHPYYRTPALQRGAVFRPFSLAAARTNVTYLGSVSFALRFLRSLLVRDVVYRTDLDGFVCKMEALAGHLLQSHNMPVSNLFPREAVRLLGIRYLILDTLFVASKVLGQAGHTSSWWQELVSQVPNEVDFRFTRSFGGQFMANVYLAEDLCTCIEMLKMGIRPSREATIQLKRQLFCERSSPPYFKRRSWDPWRADDRNYGGGLR
ncbi:hypothetical protein EBH_0014890 [Eimeria brunetti]|uniref:Uncharacterized protein n=1 Tax=Eimeria brunetti TaxID=51314 RepID=U6LAF2_9EIME|nr:hypothetical protein EBH_0014890 [Eimeria brunetti]